jgi:hypothetical protein
MPTTQYQPSNGLADKVHSIHNPFNLPLTYNFYGLIINFQGPAYPDFYYGWKLFHRAYETLI